MLDEDSLERLTEDERARLRSTVDVGALERLLGTVPQDSRRLLFLACTSHVTDAELMGLGLDVPPVPDEPPSTPAVAVTVANGRQAHRLKFLPTRNIHLVLHHLPDPALDRLWQQVEPSAHRGA
jgi:hypothetical protein